MSNNIEIAAVLLNGEKIENGKAVSTNIEHSELNEKMQGIHTPEEAQEFSKETGARFTIAGEHVVEQKLENVSEKSNDSHNHSYSRTRERSAGMDFDR